ncbi:3-demethylubiquinone-9 3-methyltransferase [Olavius sp. associated proteobacterium Delta 1]|nr:3-demethylubiquinone-9 3-methyltransferase [Olavius sp. associated proteobacterium Delta 1]
MPPNNKLSESEIRPDDLMQKQRIAMLSDIGRLLSKRSDFVLITCPACDSGKYSKCYEKYGLDYVLCQNCETMYINPRPSHDVLEWFYRESENYAYWNKYIFPASEEARHKKIVIPRVEKVLDLCSKYRIASEAILEVGAGFGTFCREVAVRGAFNRVVAIEPTPDLANTCREKGIEVIESSIENVDFSNGDKFDVVVSFEVIEHLFSPKSFLAACWNVLKDDGIIIVTCPNAKGFDFITLGSFCNSADHEHLNYFNPVSLTLLLQRCGFEMLECLTPGRLDAELVRKKILAGEFDVSHQPFLQQILIDKWEQVGEAFQDFLSKSGLSSNMWLVARKKTIEGGKR